MACINNRCVDPCPGICGVHAICDVSNHIPSCSCPTGYSGNAFIACRPTPIIKPPEDLCNPSSCGPNSKCREVNGAAVCTCQSNMIGTQIILNPNQQMKLLIQISFKNRFTT